MVAKVEAAAVVRIAATLKTNKQTKKKLSGVFGGPGTLPGTSWLSAHTLKMIFFL